MSTGPSDGEAVSQVEVPVDSGLGRSELMDYFQGLYAIYGGCESLEELANTIIQSDPEIKRVYGDGPFPWSGGEEVAQKIEDLAEPGLETLDMDADVPGSVELDYDTSEIDGLSGAYELRRWMEAQAGVVEEALTVYTREEDRPELEQGVSAVIDVSRELVDEVKVDAASPEELKEDMLETGKEREVADAAAEELETAQVYAEYIREVSEEFPDMVPETPAKRLLVP